MRINGTEETGYEGRTLLEYLEEKGYRPALIAVEYNGDILERAAFDKVILKEDDIVEIVSFVGGG